MLMFMVFESDDFSLRDVPVFLKTPRSAESGNLEIAASS